MVLVIPLKLVFIRQEPEDANCLFLGLFDFFFGDASSADTLGAFALFQRFVNVQGEKFGCAGMGVDDVLKGRVDGGLECEGGGKGGREDEGVFVKEEEDGVDPLEGECEWWGGGFGFGFGFLGGLLLLLDGGGGRVDGFTACVDIEPDSLFQRFHTLIRWYFAEKLVEAFQIGIPILIDHLDETGAWHVENGGQVRCEEGSDEEGLEVRERGGGEVVDRTVVFFGKTAGDVG